MQQVKTVEKFHSKSFVLLQVLVWTSILFPFKMDERRWSNVSSCLCIKVVRQCGRLRRSAATRTWNCCLQCTQRVFSLEFINSDGPGCTCIQKGEGRRSDENIIKVWESRIQKSTRRGKGTQRARERERERERKLNQGIHGTVLETSWEVRRFQFGQAPVQIRRMLHEGFFARSYKSKALEMELLQPEVIVQIFLFDELSCGQ